MASVQATSTLMEHIQRSIGNVSSQVNEIGLATREQSTTGGEIGKRMEESAQEVSQNAAATQELSTVVHEISRTASDLAMVSETMALAVGKFQI